MSQLVLSVFAIIVAVCQPIAFGDTRITPDIVRVFSSSSGNYQLRVSGSEGWKTPNASAELWHASSSSEQRTHAWRIDKLPHRLGPAFALVSNSGVVILVDEWVKTPSPLSITVIDTTGKTTAVYSFEDISRITGESAKSLVKAATIGTWQTSLPKFDDNQERIRFCTGETSLVLHVKTGRISAEPK